MFRIDKSLIHNNTKAAAIAAAASSSLALNQAEAAVAGTILSETLIYA
jgi:hypothetical protein